ncbi:MAG: hypothetical protein K8R69_11930, partial [Deltaproteobacteria bacterium]|nr:hypothetical protein [Deltaproteobacteria bacterium]
RGKTERGKLRLNPAHVLATYVWPVHFISEEFKDPKQLPRGQYHLLLWREPDTLDVKFMEVNPLVASLIQRLERKQAKPAELLPAIARANALKASPEFLAEGRALLADLAAKKLFV